MPSTGLLVVCFLLFVACAGDKKVLMTARTSAGRASSTITFYHDGTYSISDESFLNRYKTRGTYQMNDSLITITLLKDNSFLKSTQLLLKRDSFADLILYQLDAARNIDSTLLEFDVTME